MFGDGGPKSWLALGRRQWIKVVTITVALLLCWAAIVGYQRHQESSSSSTSPETGEKVSTSTSTSTSSTSTIHKQKRPETFQASGISKSGYLHLVFPATKGGHEFCQGIISAATLDYPTPRVVNWGPGRDDSDKARVRKIFDYLNGHGPDKTDDLVIISDPKHVWFQLRPSVLIDRFYAINERANLKTRESLGKGFKQHIVFSAQEECDSSDKAACHSASDSFLAPSTGSTHINPSTIIGRLGHLRALFEHAATLIEEDESYHGSSHEVFTRIFGQQEHQRLANMQDQKNNGQREDDATTTTTTVTRSPNSEFHIGLDYFGEISQPTVSSSREISWVVFNDTESSNSRHHDLATDISRSTPPLWTSDLTGATKLPNEEWATVPLLTNVDNGITPPIIHHSAHRNDDVDSHVLLQWSDLYFQPHLRPLLHTKATAYRMPHAVVSSPGNPEMKEEWWGPIDERGLILFDMAEEGNMYKNWDEMCGSRDAAAELFDDGKGPWVNPIYYLYWGSDQARYEEWLEREGREAH